MYAVEVRSTSVYVDSLDWCRSRKCEENAVIQLCVAAWNRTQKWTGSKWRDDRLLRCVAGAGDILDELLSVLNGGSVADESFDTEDNECTVASATSTDSDQSGPQSLFELCSRVVGKHCTCATLERQSPPLDEGLLRRVIFYITSLYLHCLVCPQRKQSQRIFSIVFISVGQCHCTSAHVRRLISD